jgi:hypothetical protein
MKKVYKKTNKKLELILTKKEHITKKGDLSI